MLMMVGFLEYLPLLVAHLQRIVARFQLVECYGIGSLVGAVPFAVVDAVLETDIIGVPVVEQRELQSE